MSVIRNPKQAGSVLHDCIPQTGPCPVGCNQCFYNRPGAFYTDIAQPLVPDPADLPEGAIVRINSGNDSNWDRERVIETAAQYPRAFFNTSIPRFDFPGPVVLTVNPEEERGYRKPQLPVPANLMFVRIRVSPANAALVVAAVAEWTAGAYVPVVLTFMRYYDQVVPANTWPFEGTAYEYRTHILNSYWCPTPAFTRAVMKVFEHNRLVSMCGSHLTGTCTACRNCETHYLQAAKRLRGE